MQLEIKVFNSFCGKVRKIWLDFQRDNDCYVFQSYECKYGPCVCARWVECTDCFLRKNCSGLVDAPLCCTRIATRNKSRNQTRSKVTFAEWKKEAKFAKYERMDDAASAVPSFCNFRHAMLAFLLAKHQVVNREWIENNETEE